MVVIITDCVVHCSRPIVAIYCLQVARKGNLSFRGGGHCPIWKPLRPILFRPVHLPV